MLRTVLELVGHGRFHFVTRQMLGQLLVAGPQTPPPRVLGNRLFDDDLGLRFGNGLGQSRGRVGRGVAVAEVDLQLIRVFQISLAAALKGPLQEFGEGQLQLLMLLLQLFLPPLQLFDRQRVRLDGVNVRRRWFALVAESVPGRRRDRRALK